MELTREYFDNLDFNNCYSFDFACYVNNCGGDKLTHEYLRRLIKEKEGSNILEQLLDIIIELEERIDKLERRKNAKRTNN